MWGRQQALPWCRHGGPARISALQGTQSSRHTPPCLPPPPPPAPQGTKSSKRKKQNKLKRVMQTLKKQERRSAATTNESFAAVHLLHDPQTFAERLFARLQSGGERYETRLAVTAVVSRCGGPAAAA